MATSNQKKFISQNPVQKNLIDAFQKKFLAVLQSVHPKTIFEAGCGEGYLLAAIHQQFPNLNVLGVDTNAAALAEGQRLFPGLHVAAGDIYALNQPDKSWDITIASEVLEHLDQPIRALEELRRVAQRYVLLSVPHEPWFRLGNLARGRHVKRLGNHPEHVNLWSRKSFVRFVSQRLTVQTVTGAFPWTIVLAKP